MLISTRKGLHGLLFYAHRTLRQHYLGVGNHAKHMLCFYENHSFLMQMRISLLKEMSTTSTPRNCQGQAKEQKARDTNHWYLKPQPRTPKATNQWTKVATPTQHLGTSQVFLILSKVCTSSNGGYMCTHLIFSSSLTQDIMHTPNFVILYKPILWVASYNLISIYMHNIYKDSGKITCIQRSLSYNPFPSKQLFVILILSCLC